MSGKYERAAWLQAQNQTWEAMRDEIGPARLEQPGVNGAWSMKDGVPHLTGWQHKLVNDLQAAQRGQSDRDGE